MGSPRQSTCSWQSVQMRSGKAAAAINKKKQTMKIDHSWLKAEKSKSALLPVSQYARRSGWRRRKRTPKGGRANLFLFPFPYMHTSWLSVPHLVCAELPPLIAYFRPCCPGAYGRTHQSNTKKTSLFDCNSIRRRVPFTFSHSRTSQRICPLPRCCFAHCICKSNKDGIHSDNTCCLGGIHPSR